MHASRLLPALPDQTLLRPLGLVFADSLLDRFLDRRLIVVFGFRFIKKSAERIIVDLREKVGLPTYYGRKSEPEQQALTVNDEALDALMALGFTLADATKALEGVDVKLPVEERIRQALKNR